MDLLEDAGVIVGVGEATTLGMKVACVGDDAKHGAGDWNLTSFRELEEIVR